MVDDFFQTWVARNDEVAPRFFSRSRQTFFKAFLRELAERDENARDEVKLETGCERTDRAKDARICRYDDPRHPHRLREMARVDGTASAVGNQREIRRIQPDLQRD